jgi:hypothetical protein
MAASTTRFGISAVLALLAFSLPAFAAPHGMYYTQAMRAQKGAPTHQANGQDVLYFGGPVISHAKVYAVMWGSSVNSTTQKQIGDFYAAITNSTHFDWLKQYNTRVSAVDGRAGTQQDIGRGTYNGIFVITPSHTDTSLQDADIQAELQSQIAAGKLPKNDDNSLYMIYFPPGVNITIDGMSSCQAFCAYHDGFKSASLGNIYYGVMPDLGGACLFGCGFFPNRFDAVTVISAHELIEAVTDPFPTPADKPAYPQAWNTSDGQEIGDLCAFTTNTLTTQGLTYTIQGEYDKTTGACTDGTYQSP